jgi:hypothetical protein
MEENKNLEQNLDKSNEKLHISDVINSVDEKLQMEWFNNRLQVLSKIPFTKHCL